MEDYRQSKEYCQYFIKKGWVVKKIETTRVLLKKFLWLGYVIKVQRGSADISVNKLERFAKQNNALVMVVEPNINTEDKNYFELEDSLKMCGYKDFDLFLSPTKTSYVDLIRSEKCILESFDKDIRKSLNINFERKISFQLVDRIENMHPLLTDAGIQLHYFVQTLHDWLNKWKPFGDEIKVILAYLDGNLLGGNMILIRPPVAFGIFLPITKYGRNQRVASSLIWEGLKLAKNNGCTKFDLNGLYDDRYKSPEKWQGLTIFKKKFKGREVEFMHPKVKIYSWFFKLLDHLGLLWMFFVDSN